MEKKSELDKQVIKYIGAGKFRNALEQNGVEILAYDNDLKAYHARASLDVIYRELCI